MQKLDCEPPQYLQEAITSLKPSFWLKRACSRYRRCSSIHFGLGVERNLQRARGGKYVFGKYSHIVPEVQAQLLAYIKSVAPNVQFSSIILNRFDPGDRMGKHVDGNIFPLQISIRFGEAVGAELCTGDQRLGGGVFLMDTTIPHEVSLCEAGVRYSIVTFCKESAVKLVDLRHINTLHQWGYPVQILILLHVILLLRCLQNISYQLPRDPP